ncbi:MAG: hypothetical protein AB7F99_17145 [Vicinamibacterales bacterium]
MLALAILVATANTAAGECVTLPPSMAIERADVIFEGRIRELHGFFARPDYSFRSWIVTFDVSRVWKGTVGEAFTLHLLPIDMDGMYKDFELGGSYVVFSALNDQRLDDIRGIKGPTYGSHLCSGTFATGGSRDDRWREISLKELGPGRPVP